MVTRRPPPTPMMRIGLLVFSGVLLAAAALLAGSVGPWTARPQDSSTPRSVPTFADPTALPTLTLPAAPTLSTLSILSDPAASADRPSSNPGIVLYLLGGLLLVALLLMAAAMLRKGRTGGTRRDPKSVPEPVAPNVPMPDPQRPFDTREAADFVIACWDQLEHHAAARGSGRRREQTPTEFIRSLEKVCPLDGRASADLLALYQRARFDHVRLLPDTVDRALVCTATLIDAVSSWPVAR